jgi:hypothetical protein
MTSSLRDQLGFDPVEIGPGAWPKGRADKIPMNAPMLAKARLRIDALAHIGLPILSQPEVDAWAAPVAPALSGSQTGLEPVFRADQIVKAQVGAKLVPPR